MNTRKHKREQFKNNQESLHDVNRGSFKVIPNDIILLILFYFNPIELVTISKVSKLFYKLASHDRLWKLFLEQDTNVTTPKLSAKQTFIQHPEKILLKYSQFVSLFYKEDKIKKFLRDLENKEELNGKHWTVPTLTSSLNKRLEQSNNDTKISRLKKLFLKFSNTKSIHQFNSQAVNSLYALPLQLIIDILDEMGSQIGMAQPFDRVFLQHFYDIFIGLIKNHGEKAAILAPRCLDKILDYLKTQPSTYKIQSLATILCHKLLVTNADLPELIDAIVERLENGCKLPASSCNVGLDAIVNDVMPCRNKLVKK